MIQIKKYTATTILVMIVVLMLSCKKDRGFDIFSKKQDVELGLKMKEEIESSSDYTILDSIAYRSSYQYLNGIKNTILNNASDINNKEEFVWEVFIINEDVLNAFACPGGYLYFYTGLMKYLDNEAQLAGVMAHEMAHVELRHSTRQLTSMYGYSIMVDMILGKANNQLDSVLRGVTGNLTFLAFSREFEYDADKYAVKFLSDCGYNPLGVAGFFEKLEDEDQLGTRVPVFLSTHPSPEDRIDKIYETWESEGSKTGDDYVARYQTFKNALP